MPEERSRVCKPRRGRTISDLQPRAHFHRTEPSRLHDGPVIPFPLKIDSILLRQDHSFNEIKNTSISFIPDGESREGDLSCPHNSQLNIKGEEAIDIDHRIMKQQYTTLFPLNGIWVVERPVVWHAKKIY